MDGVVYRFQDLCFFDVFEFFLFADIGCENLKSEKNILGTLLSLIVYLPLKLMLPTEREYVVALSMKRWLFCGY